MNKRIAILTLSVGSGHVQAAKAIERALEDGAEPIEVRVFDAVELARPWFLWLYVHSYWWMLRRAPGIWRGLFDRRQRKRHRSTAPHWVFRRGCAEVLRRLKDFSPRLVIVTEIGAAEIAALAKREGWFNAPILAVHTDLETEPPWAQREIDVFSVASDRARAQLIEWGISPNRILVCGIPIDPAFALPFDRPELLRALGLDSHRPVVLVMGGGMGPVPLDEVVHSLEQCGLSIQVLAVAGHNQALRARLEALRGKVALTLHLFGWTDNVPELMAAADLVITKPGGVTMAEALAAGRPMILTHPIPGPEEAHALHLQQSGVALRARSLEDIPHLAFRLLNNPRQLAEIERRARELARPEAAHAIAQVARALLEKGSYIDLLATPGTRPGESAYLM
ncbi:MAG: glycosyltransferase [Terriglobia bacterium]|jgi:processive 1,2-diacylglycerol beta-glucosyltransferase